MDMMDFVSKKMDRVFSNIEWMRVFPNTAVDFLVRGISNHSPALVTIDQLPSFGPKPFQFFDL
jgi:hypothetical protein